MIREGRSYEHDWLLDRDGVPSRDPRVVEDGGTLLAAGGLDHGQKGYGMALHAEALTQGLPASAAPTRRPGPTPR